MTRLMTTAPLDPYGKDAHHLVRASGEPTISKEMVPLRDMLMLHHDELAALLPVGVEMQRVLAELYLAARKTPLLLKVAAAELIPALGNAIQRGGIIGQDSYLVPFFSKSKNKYEVSVMENYQFKQQLVVAAGGARSFESRAVYSKESFEVHYGTSARIEHSPLPPDRRGVYRGSYTVARLGHGECKFVWLELGDIEQTRKNSRDWNPTKMPECPPWYGHKTSSNLCIKGMLSNPKLRHIGDMIAAAEQAEFGEVIPEGTFTDLPSDEVVAEVMRPAHVDADGVDRTCPEASGTDDPPGDVWTMTLREACELTMRGQKFGDVRNSGLHAFREWAVKTTLKSGVSETLANIVLACDTILDARAAGTIPEPAKSAKAVA